MRPGDLVGVASMLEREPFKYELSASKDSQITLVDESCMESELKRLPLWLLALIRTLSAKTHQLKRSMVSPRVQDTLKSLAEFLSRKDSNTEYNLAELIREYSFLTKVSTKVAQEDTKSLLRRHLIKLTQKNNRIFCKVTDPLLLQIFVDYLGTPKDSTFTPYKLTIDQKKILVLLSTVGADETRTGPDWITFIQQIDPEADVSLWIRLLKLEWFNAQSSKDDLYVVNGKKVNYFLKALRYETNIRGVL